MSVRIPIPNPNLPPLRPGEIPEDPTRDERPAAPPEGDVADAPDVMNPIS